MIGKNTIHSLEAENLRLANVVGDLTNKLLKAQEDADFLECLKACGVDNWGGYADAVGMFNGDYEEDGDEE